MTDTYTNRNTKAVQIEKIDGSTIVFDGGWHFGGLPTDVVAQLKVGEVYIMETRQFSRVLGLGTNTPDVVWLWRKSDQQVEREHQDMLDQQSARDAARLAENKADWQRRTRALPDPLRKRIERFHDNGGVEFEKSGWDYELVVSELAVLYKQSGGQDTPDIEAYAAKEGTSGNQHNAARALAGRGGDYVVNFPSALTPITGDPDYSGKGT